MSKYRILKLGSKYIVQKRVLLFFWVTWCKFHGFGSAVEFDTVESAEKVIKEEINEKNKVIVKEI